jgi:hypothetical protein
MGGVNQTARMNYFHDCTGFRESLATIKALQDDEQKTKLETRIQEHLSRCRIDTTSVEAFLGQTA